MTAYLFVGGSGRSGTSFLAKKLSDSNSVIGLEDIELKIFGEVHGFPDLYSALVSHYSLHRAKQAIKNFKQLFKTLYGDVYTDQLKMQEYLAWPAAELLLENFLERLSSGEMSYPIEISPHQFRTAVNQFIGDLFAQVENGENPEYRLEKTPHNLLNTLFLDSIFSGSRFVHVTRDPRAVVWSLKSMTWGPNTLEDCVKWYRAYHISWMKERARCALAGVEVFEMRIEDLNFERDAVIGRLRDYLAADINIDMQGYNYEKLLGMHRQASSEESALLDELLQDIIVESGYRIDSLGVPNRNHVFPAY